MDENKEKLTSENTNTDADALTDTPAEEKEGGDKRWGIFMIIVLIGFVAIYFLVTRGYNAIALHFGWKPARALALMLVALFWYIWGQVCLYIKNEHNIDCLKNSGTATAVFLCHETGVLLFYPAKVV